MTWAIDQELQVKEKMVLVVLAHYLNNKTGQCNPSLVRLAKDSGMCKRSVIRAIKELEEKKLIVPVRQKQGLINASNQYSLALNSVTQSLGVVTDSHHQKKKAVSHSHHPSVTQSLGVVTDSHKGSVTQSPKQGIEQRNKNKEVEQGKKDAPKFQKPTADEISAFCLDSDIAIDVQHFIDYYESNGWRVGRNPMKNWQATVRNWAKNDKTFRKPAQTSFKKPYGEPPKYELSSKFKQDHGVEDFIDSTATTISNKGINYGR